jgi:hypothetical protein
MTGFVGVALLVRDRIGLKGDLSRALPAIGAALVAALLYGIAANYTKKRLMSVPPLVASAVCQVGAAVVLLPLTLLTFPAVMPSAKAWGALVALGVACTALASSFAHRAARTRARDRGDVSHPGLRNALGCGLPFGARHSWDAGGLRGDPVRHGDGDGLRGRAEGAADRYTLSPRRT